MGLISYPTEPLLSLSWFCRYRFWFSLSGIFLVTNLLPISSIISRSTATLPSVIPVFTAIFISGASPQEQLNQGTSVIESLISGVEVIFCDLWLLSTTKYANGMVYSDLLLTCRAMCTDPALVYHIYSDCFQLKCSQILNSRLPAGSEFETRLG